VIRLLDIGPIAERLGGGTYIAMEWLPDALDQLLCAQSTSQCGTGDRTVPSPVRAIVEQALQKDPRARFATADELASRIAAVDR
jgi:hypothetical protein